MKTFYRLELIPEPGELIGKGPYRGYLSDGIHNPVDILFESKNDDGLSMSTQSHPTPNNDEGLKFIWEVLIGLGSISNYVFGFKSLNQLHSWFFFNEGGVKNLIEQYPIKMRVSIFIVEDDYYHSGQFQAIAHTDHMQLFKTLTIEEAFEQGK